VKNKIAFKMLHNRTDRPSQMCLMNENFSLVYRTITQVKAGVMAVCDGPGSFREAAFSLNFLALIDGVFSRLVDTIAGTGRRTIRQFNSTNLMSQNNESQELTIDTPEGWVFAFEGGAHILFRHTPTLDRRFVRSLLIQVWRLC
jgi:hypothetical protein